MIRLSPASLLVVGTLLALLGLPYSVSAQSGSNDIRGFLDVATFEQAAGWACVPSQPLRPLFVQIYVDERLVSVVTANQRREAAVGQQCGGNSFHGFTFNFSESTQNLLSNGQRHTVRAFVQTFFPTFARRELSNSPLYVTFTNRLPIGFLDVANRNVVSGWTCDPDDFNRALRVDIYIDNQFVGSTTANQQRESAVGDQCGGNSFHGYTFTVPASIQNQYFNGQPRTVQAYAINYPTGTNPQLTGSPRTVV